MRLLSISACLLLSTSAVAQTSTVETAPDTLSSQTTPTVLLATTVSQLGWDVARAKFGVIAKGSKIVVDETGSEASSVPMSLEIRADHRFRMTLGTGEVLTVADAVMSIRRGTTAKPIQLLPHQSLSMIPPYLPFLTDVTAINDSAIQVAADSATTTIGGETASGLVIRRTFPTVATFKGAREKASPMTVWVSQKTGLPLKIDFFRLAADNWMAQIPYSVLFSDWQQISGVMVPMQIDEMSGTVVISRIRLSSVQFTSTIPDSDFVQTQGGTN